MAESDMTAPKWKEKGDEEFNQGNWSKALSHYTKNILNTCCGRNDKPDSIPDEALCKKHKKVIDKILSCLLDKIENETTTSIARDALIKFITRNIHYTALHWAKRLVEFGGLQKLMEVASQCESGYYDGYYNLFDITSSTQTITSVCLAKIDENLDENDKEEFFNIINGFIREELNSNDVACHRLNDLLIKQVICEFIYVVVTRYDKSNTFIGRSITTLGILCYTEDLDNFEDLDNSENLNTSEDLHDSENLKNSIRVRAFVDICKMTKFKELKKNLLVILIFYNEQSIKSWLKVCRPFLINPQRDMKKWAVEGLSYLTFDLNIKNKLIEDQRAIRAIIEFAKTENQSILYQVDILLVNLCSAYDKEHLIPKMEMFVNYFDVKNQILAEDKYVEERLRVLAEAGVTSALVSLAKTGSENSKELIARVFNAICSQQDLRKIVVQEGGTETLLSLALNGTNIGKTDATRALVYLALTPEIAFPDQISMEVVRTITNNLLNPECSVNERCDALTALCNLSSVNNSMREHIFRTECEKIEQCMRDDNNMLKQTSIQLINNLVLSHKVAIQFVEQRSDHLFDLMNWSVKDDTDDHTKKALAETLATLTAASKETCEKLLGWDLWPTFLPFLLNDPDDELQYKGTEIALNMMQNAKDVAAKLIKTDTIIKRVRELSDDTVQNKEIKELASHILEATAEWDKRDIERNRLSQSTDNIEHSIKKYKRE
ncbi:protein unc-45 homolog B-like [Temnothorax longispinosus]|uniref:protein unc-45 homolog B-like n=1 Tax=Temnothorax longispinosus TaxID=300112 RepID=UPI003A9A2264